MAGTSPLSCGTFVETDTYARSKQDLMERLELTARDVDDRLDALIWALYRDSTLVAEQVGARNLWVAVTDYPRLRVYLRPRSDVQGECELLWIEEG
jgi:hypothetical protein